MTGLPRPRLQGPYAFAQAKTAILKSTIFGHVPTPQAAGIHTAAISECRPVLQPTAAFQVSNSKFSGASFRGGQTLEPDGFQWLLKRNCSLAPAQLAALYFSLCVLSSGIAVFFWMQGARLVAPFACLELLAVGAAFLVHARHAGDKEKIILQGEQLVVELETAGRLQRAAFNREWVRVEPKDGDGSLIEVSGQGRSVRIGRHVRPELRPALAREIRRALSAR